MNCALCEFAQPRRHFRSKSYMDRSNSCLCSILNIKAVHELFWNFKPTYGKNPNNHSPVDTRWIWYRWPIQTSESASELLKTTQNLKCCHTFIQTLTFAALEAILFSLFFQSITGQCLLKNPAVIFNWYGIFWLQAAKFVLLGIRWFELIKLRRIYAAQHLLSFDELSSL